MNTSSIFFIKKKQKKRSLTYKESSETTTNSSTCTHTAMTFHSSSMAKALCFQEIKKF